MPQQTSLEVQPTVAAPSTQATHQITETELNEPSETVDVNADDDFNLNWLPLSDFVTQGYVVLDMTSGNQVMGDNADLPLEAGSLTHLMTLYTVLTDAAYDPHKTVVLGDVISPEAVFSSGETITTETALFAMYYDASEEAAQALVDSYGPGSEEFLKKMNRNAQSLGMSNTSYLDPTGGNLGSTTTAEDTAKLLQVLKNLTAFRAISESAGYLLPNNGNYNVAGLDQLTNPATMIDVMSSDYLTQLNGLMLADSVEGWSYGAGSARTNDGRELLAVVLGAASKNEAIQGEQRAAHAIRTLLEESAKSLGVQAVENRSILALTAQAEQTKPTEPAGAMEITDEKSTVTERETTVEETTVETVPIALADESNRGNRRTIGWTFYAILGVLLLALIALIISVIVMARKKKAMEKRRRATAARSSQFSTFYRR